MKICSSPPTASETKASRWPSGDQAGSLSAICRLSAALAVLAAWAVTWRGWRGEPFPARSATKTALRGVGRPSLSRTASTQATRAPSGERATPRKVSPAVTVSSTCSMAGGAAWAAAGSTLAIARRHPNVATRRLAMGSLLPRWFRPGELSRKRAGPPLQAAACSSGDLKRSVRVPPKDIAGLKRFCPAETLPPSPDRVILTPRGAIDESPVLCALSSVGPVLRRLCLVSAPGGKPCLPGCNVQVLFVAEQP